MGTTQNDLQIITLFIIFVAISANYSVIAFNTTGFSVKIFHRDSKESPLYPGDHLTQQERLMRLVQQSRARARYIGPQVSFYKSVDSNPGVPRFPVSRELEPGSFYVAEVQLGTFTTLPYPHTRSYHLMVDSGSELTWTQCKPPSNTNLPTFKQLDPLYPSTSSNTYKPLQCNQAHHSLCYEGKCKKNTCTYEVKYMTGSVTQGVLAIEEFTATSDKGVQHFPFIMGCGFKQTGFSEYFKSGYIAGIFGLGYGPRSIAAQVVGSRGIFAYCLKHYNEEHSSTYIRFGSNAWFGLGGKEVKRTPLHFGISGAPNLYFLILEGISVGRKPIGFPRGTFHHRPPSGRGGCVIDTGSPFTLMRHEIFHTVAKTVESYFLNTWGIHRHFPGQHGYFEYCFIPNKNFSYPTMTFHFESADFVLNKAEAIFHIVTHYFCLGLVGMDGDKLDVILGAMQQADKRILHNPMGPSLSFVAEEKCWMG